MWHSGEARGEERERREERGGGGEGNKGTRLHCWRDFLHEWSDLVPEWSTKGQAPLALGWLTRPPEAQLIESILH